MGALWAEGRAEEVVRLWGQNLTGSEIAKIMGGLTRSAVIGKINRLGIPKRDGLKRQPTHKKLAPGYTPKPRKKHIIHIAATQPALVPPEPPPPPRPALSKTHTCKWPLGNPNEADFHYCDAPSELGRSYCSDHLYQAHSHKPIRLIYVAASIV